MSFAEDFAKTIAAGQRRQELLRDFRGLTKAETMTVTKLRALWDSYDGTETSDPDISGETVHFVLNQRGDGDYCAV